MSRFAQSLACSLVLCTVAGCDLDPAPDGLPADLSFRSPKISWGGGGFQNTFLLTDGSFAGVVRKDIQTPLYHQSPGSPESVKLALVEVPGNLRSMVALTEIWADEDGLHGKACSTCRTRGPDEFVGARFHFTRQVDTQISVRGEVTDILRIEEFDGVYLPSYRFVYDEHPDPAAPDAQVCPPGEEGGHFATIYQDVDVDLATGDLFDPAEETLMFGCHSGAIAKADIEGYGLYNGFDLATQEAAVRVIRADYCGSGDTWTNAGETIYLQDSVGVQPIEIDSATESDQLEALWGLDGALCVHTPRLWQHDVGDIVCEGVPIPVCAPDDTLGDHPGAMFLSKLFEPGFLAP